MRLAIGNWQLAISNWLLADSAKIEESTLKL